MLILLCDKWPKCLGEKKAAVAKGHAGNPVWAREKGTGRVRRGKTVAHASHLSSRVAVSEWEVFRWSRIPNNTGSQSRIFLSYSDSGCRIESFFTSHSLSWKFLLKWYNFFWNFCWIRHFLPRFPLTLTAKFHFLNLKGSEVGNFGKLESDILPPTPEACSQVTLIFIWTHDVWWRPLSSSSSSRATNSSRRKQICPGVPFNTPRSFMTSSKNVVVSSLNRGDTGPCCKISTTTSGFLKTEKGRKSSTSLQNPIRV